MSQLSTFVRCADGKWYEELVYQDFPQRRAWFICFSEEEPAEIVVREDTYKEMRPEEILRRRGFDRCVKAIVNGRKDPHQRFFGTDAQGAILSANAASAISWFIVFKKGVPLPAPNQYDSCIEIYPYFPNKPGVYFGDIR